jgi:hypothetical protein
MLGFKCLFKHCFSLTIKSPLFLNAWYVCLFYNQMLYLLMIRNMYWTCELIKILEYYIIIGTGTKRVHFRHLYS